MPFRPRFRAASPSDRAFHAAMPNDHGGAAVKKGRRALHAGRMSDFHRINSPILNQFKYKGGSVLHSVASGTATVGLLGPRYGPAGETRANQGMFNPCPDATRFARVGSVGAHQNQVPPRMFEVVGDRFRGGLDVPPNQRFIKAPVFDIVFSNVLPLQDRSFHHVPLACARTSFSCS